MINKLFPLFARFQFNRTNNNFSKVKDYQEGCMLLYTLSMLLTSHLTFKVGSKNGFSSLHPPNTDLPVKRLSSLTLSLNESSFVLYKNTELLFLAFENLANLIKSTVCHTTEQGTRMSRCVHTWFMLVRHTLNTLEQV